MTYSTKYSRCMKFPGTCFFLQEVPRNLSTIPASITEVNKGTSFKWNPKARSAFEEVKKKLT